MDTCVAVSIYGPAIYWKCKKKKKKKKKNVMVLATESQKYIFLSQTIKIYASGQTGMFDLIIVHRKNLNYNIFAVI